MKTPPTGMLLLREGWLCWLLAREKIFIFFMPPIDEFDFHELVPELLLFRMNLDIPAFVRVAVRTEMSLDEMLGCLHIITNTPLATDKMWRIAIVSQNRELTRNELLVWLHIAYGGSRDPEHLSRKLRIPAHAAEEALATLAEKGILRERRCAV